MIYLNENIITIPNILGIDSSSYVLEFKNNVTNEIFTLEAQNQSDNEIYYQFVIDASQMARNEYKITLYDNASNNLGNYLAQYGIVRPENLVYEQDTEYTQYEN